jgi:hypothetical protein
MPEIVDIRKYLARYAKWLGSQTPTTRHFRPFFFTHRPPEESGLEFLSAITERRVEKQGRGFFDTVEGEEYYTWLKKKAIPSICSHRRTFLSARPRWTSTTTS